MKPFITRFRIYMYAASALVGLFFVVSFIHPLGAVGFHYDISRISNKILPPEPPENYQTIRPKSGKKAGFLMTGNQLYIPFIIPPHKKDAFNEMNVNLAISPGAQPDIQLGIKSGLGNTYARFPLYHQGLEALDWPQTTEGDVTLYQKTPQFSSVSDFLAYLSDAPANVPADKKIATYFYDTKQPISRRPEIIKDYAPLGHAQEFSTALRGSFELATYIKDEELNITLECANISSANRKESIEFKITRAGDSSEVFSTTTQEPGIISARVPNLSEGVYQISFHAGNFTSNVVCKRIITPQRYLVATSDLVIADTSMNKPELFTNAHRIHTKIIYPADAQQVKVNNRRRILSRPGFAYIFDQLPGHNDMISLSFARGNVIVESDQPISFSKDSFFDPVASQITTFDETPYPDLNKFDFILTTYQKVQVNKNESGEAQPIIASKKVPFSSVFLDFQKTTLLLESQDLRELGRAITIHDIDVSIIPTKKPFFK